MKKNPPKESASEKANPSPSEPVATGEQGEPVREWCGRKDGETDGEFYRRAFEWDGAELSGMGVASFERWRRAQSVVSWGFRCAIENGAGFDEILTRPEMLRAFDCLINDPPQIAREILAPNPNPLQGGGSRETREWFISTIQEYADNIADKSGRVFSEWYTPPWGMSLTRARFEMFPVCLNLAAVLLREEWAHFITVCGFPEFEEMREWLERDRVDAGRGYVQMPALYDCEFSEEQYFDLNTGESNAPKYGGGGVRATNLLLSFRDYLRARQGVRDCEPFARPNPSAAQGANPSARDTAKPSEPVGNGAAAKPSETVGENGTGEPVAGHIGKWARTQGATAYFVGVSVCIRGTVCKLPPVNQKRGRMIADLIETETHLGAVKCDVHSAMGGNTSSAEYAGIVGFLERVNAGKRGKSANADFSGCWHIKPATVKK